MSITLLQCAMAAAAPAAIQSRTPEAGKDAPSKAQIKWLSAAKEASSGGKSVDIQGRIGRKWNGVVTPCSVLYACSARAKEVIFDKANPPKTARMAKSGKGGVHVEPCLSARLATKNHEGLTKIEKEIHQSAHLVAKNRGDLMKTENGLRRSAHGHGSVDTRS